jgi:hypothetical protein
MNTSENQKIEEKESVSTFFWKQLLVNLHKQPHIQVECYEMYMNSPHMGWKTQDIFPSSWHSILPECFLGKLTVNISFITPGQVHAEIGIVITDSPTLNYVISDDSADKDDSLTQKILRFFNIPYHLPLSFERDVCFFDVDEIQQFLLITREEYAV